FGHFTGDERRKDIRQMDLLAAFEISVGEFEVLAHYAELNVVRSQNVAQLAHDFLRTHVGAGVAGAVVPGKKQLELFARLPALASAKNPRCLGALDVSAHPGLENRVPHAAEPPTSDGQGRKGKVKFAS